MNTIYTAHSIDVRYALEKEVKKRKTNNLLNDLTKIKTPRRVKPSRCEGRKTRGGKQKWLKRWDGWDIEGRPEFPYLVVTIQFSGCFYSGRIVRPFPVASIQIVSVCVIFCCVVNIRLVLNAIRTWISAWKMIVPPKRPPSRPDICLAGVSVRNDSITRHNKHTSP